MLLKGGKVVIDDDIKEVDLRIRREKITEIAVDLASEVGEEVIDITDKLVFPGIIDSHTHFKLYSRGTITADDFYWGGRSAAFGGVTTIIDYADQLPDSLLKGLEKRIAEADDAVIDYNLHLVINNNFLPEKQIDELKKLRNAGVSSLKLFTTYQGMYMLDDEKWPPIMEAARQAQLLITVHAEKDEIIQKNMKKYKAEGKLGVEYHPDIRPGIAEGKAIRNLCNRAKEAHTPLYIVHLSSQEGYKEVLKAKKEGLDIYVETTPHYLLLTRKLLEGPEGRLNLMTPPLREAEDNEALWEGVINGIINVIATDHCAFSIKQKEQGSNSLDIFPGIPGVETLLPLIYTYGVKKGRISLPRMVELLSTNPAKIFGLYPRKGSLKIGTDADLVVFDPNIEIEFKGDSLHSKAGYTPYQGMKVYGLPIITILRGKVIVRKNQFLGQKGFGRFIKANKSSAYSE